MHNNKFNKKKSWQALILLTASYISSPSLMAGVALGSHEVIQSGPYSQAGQIVVDVQKALYCGGTKAALKSLADYVYIYEGKSVETLELIKPDGNWKIVHVNWSQR